MKAHERIIFALDFNDGLQALNYADLLFEHVGMFKIGLELFIANGPAILRELSKMGASVMLDLKLHDIPETVERAIAQASEYDAVKLITLHAQQSATLERAANVAKSSGVSLCCVTVLTSMTNHDCKDLLFATDVFHRTINMARLANRYGINNFVCSSIESKWLKQRQPDSVLIVPGIRPAGANHNDQKRVSTPSEAIKNSADYLVIGRPIRDAADPIAAVEKIIEEINGSAEI